MKRRIQRCCKGLIHVEDSDDIHTAEVGLLHRTVEEFITKDDRFDGLVARADPQLVRDPNTSLMAMALRLLKGDSDYTPEWTSWLSPEDNDYTSETEAEEKRVSTDDDSDIVDFFFLAAEAAQKSNGFSCKPYIDELDRVLSHLCPNWAGNYYRTLETESHTDWNTDVLSLAVVHHIYLYLEEELKINGRGLFHRSQRPLLCYACDFFAFDFERGTETIDFLLSNGAGPNEQFYSFSIYEQLELTTPWILAVRRAFYDNCASYESFELFSPWIQRLLNYGADTTQRVSRAILEIGFALGRIPTTLQYTTTFHFILSHLPPIDGRKQQKIIELLLDHCKKFDATDSEGTTIPAWAEKMDKRVGKLVKEGIAKRIARKQVHAL